MSSPCHLQPIGCDCPLSSCLTLEPHVLITTAVGLLLQPDEFTSNFLRKSKKFSKTTTGVLWRYSTKALARPATKTLYVIFSIFWHNTNPYPKWEYKHENDQLQQCSREAGYIQSLAAQMAFQTHPRNGGYLANGLEINLPPFRRTKVYPWFLLHTDTRNRWVKVSFTKGNKQEDKSISRHLSVTCRELNISSHWALSLNPETMFYHVKKKKKTQIFIKLKFLKSRLLGHSHSN